jgi:xanthine/CO dehydrogenase XdhC/CoxF family maturation factor
VNELQPVSRAAAELARLNEPALLATVVRVEGSTYRRPGARMLVTPAGRRVGCVSGGCLEADIARRGWQLTESGRPALIAYDSTADEDVQWGLGLGCNGVVRVLIERLAPTAAGGGDHLGLLDACTRDRSACAVALVFAAPAEHAASPGTRVIIDERDRVLLDDVATGLSEGARAAARAGLSAGRSINQTLHTPAGPIELFIEYVEPPPALLIAGGGFDAVPLALAAKALGWRVTVADRRARYATAEHFPTADALVVCPPDEIPRRVPVDARTFAVVMNHSYPDDLAALGALLDSPARYVGLLGPSHRREKLLHDLAEAGRRPTPAQLPRLYAPVGLDVAAETPAEVATAIVAEILAVRATRSAGFLRDHDGPIHDAQHHGAASLTSGDPMAFPSPAGG